MSSSRINKNLLSVGEILLGRPNINYFLLTFFHVRVGIFLIRAYVDMKVCKGGLEN